MNFKEPSQTSRIGSLANEVPSVLTWFGRGEEPGKNTCGLSFVNGGTIRLFGIRKSVRFLL